MGTLHLVFRVCMEGVVLKYLGDVKPIEMPHSMGETTIALWRVVNS
jgi:hypothetical protein